MAYDVFISYRRLSNGINGVHIARSLQQELKSLGLNVFFDMEELTDGKFNEKLYDAIDSSKNVIFLMTEGALERCVNEGDWVRNELEHVIEKGINLVPVAPTGTPIYFPDRFPKALDSIRFLEISELNLEKLFKESVAKIAKRLKEVVLADENEKKEAEEAFLNQARRFKENDGQIDEEELKSLDQTGDELGINKARRIVLIEKVEKPIPVTVGVSSNVVKRVWVVFLAMLLIVAAVVSLLRLQNDAEPAVNEKTKEKERDAEPVNNDDVIFGCEKVQGDGFLRKAAEGMFAITQWKIKAERCSEYDGNGKLEKASGIEKEIMELLYKGKGAKAIKKLDEIKAIYQSILSRKIKTDIAKIDRETCKGDGEIRWKDRYSKYDSLWRDSIWCEDYKIAWQEVIENAYPGIRFKASVNGVSYADVNVVVNAKLEKHGGKCGGCDDSNLMLIDCVNEHHGDDNFLDVLVYPSKFTFYNSIKELEPFNIKKIVRVQRGMEFGPIWFYASKNGRPYLACIPSAKFQWSGVKDIHIDLLEVDFNNVENLVKNVAHELEKRYLSQKKRINLSEFSMEVNKIVSALYMQLSSISIVDKQLSQEQLSDKVLSILRK